MVKILINKMRIAYNVNQAWKGILPQLSEEILNDCNQYCKMDTGNLIASSYIHSKLDEGKLIWQTRYARRQYWAIRTAITDNGNPKATWKWCEAAKKQHLKQWERQAQIALRENL